MNVLGEAMRGLGAVLLNVTALLALEELTFGGLVRLILAPRPGAGNHGEHNSKKGDGRCSR